MGLFSKIGDKLGIGSARGFIDAKELKGMEQRYGIDSPPDTAMDKIKAGLSSVAGKMGIGVSAFLPSDDRYAQAHAAASKNGGRPVDSEKTSTPASQSPARTSWAEAKANRAAAGAEIKATLFPGRAAREAGYLADYHARYGKGTETPQATPAAILSQRGADGQLTDAAVQAAKTQAEGMTVNGRPAQPNTSHIANAKAAVDAMKQGGSSVPAPGQHSPSSAPATPAPAAPSRAKVGAAIG